MKATTVQTWLPFLVIAVVFFLRFRRAGQERPFSLSGWWVLPLIFTAIVALNLLALPPPPLGWAIFAAGLVPGALLGWQRGKLIDLRVGEGGKLYQRTSPLAVLLLLGIVALRMGARQLFGGVPGDPHPALAATLVTDALLGFALGLIVATRTELMLRARALLGRA